MMQSPLISVIMPVYNAESYVAQAIESILAQTMDNFEFLIVDDGSTDRSLKVLEYYAAKDDRIRLFSHDNQGIAKTRNQLLTQAVGEFIAIMDSDDIALPDRLAAQAEILQREKDIVGVGGAYQVIDEVGRLLLDRFAMPETNEQIQQLHLVGHCSLHQPCVMVRRSSVLAVGGYDEQMPVAEDFDLWLRLGEVGRLINLPQLVLQYRIHPTSVSERQQTLGVKKLREACERAWQRRGIEGTFEAIEPWRPGKDRDSQHHFMLQYGWWAFNSCQRKTAMIYGFKAIKAIPWKSEGWKLLVCALLKSPHLPNEPRGKERDSTNLTLG